MRNLSNMYLTLAWGYDIPGDDACGMTGGYGDRQATGQVTDTVILPPARPDSITWCASTMSSKLNTLAGLAW
jgi:hypothetical protein